MQSLRSLKNPLLTREQHAIREATANRAHELTQLATTHEKFLAGVDALSNIEEVGRRQTELNAIRWMLARTAFAPVAPVTFDPHSEDSTVRRVDTQAERQKLLGELPLLEQKLAAPVPFNPAEQFRPSTNASADNVHEAAKFEHARQERYYKPIRDRITVINARLQELEGNPNGNTD